MVRTRPPNLVGATNGDFEIRTPLFLFSFPFWVDASPECKLTSLCTQSRTKLKSLALIEARGSLSLKGKAEGWREKEQGLCPRRCDCVSSLAVFFIRRNQNFNIFTYSLDEGREMCFPALHLTHGKQTDTKSTEELKVDRFL